PRQSPQYGLHEHEDDQDQWNPMPPIIGQLIEEIGLNHVVILLRDDIANRYADEDVLRQFVERIVLVKIRKDRKRQEDAEPMADAADGGHRARLRPEKYATFPRTIARMMTAWPTFRTSSALAPMPSFGSTPRSLATMISYSAVASMPPASPRSCPDA